jgi:hypothetical protein
MVIEIYRDNDKPYYYTGNKILIALCALSLVTFIAQRQYLQYLNKSKEKQWATLSEEEKVAYQVHNQQEREKEGNERLDFRFKY